jgi:hypothetical protein
MSSAAAAGVEAVNPDQALNPVVRCQMRPWRAVASDASSGVDDLDGIDASVVAGIAATAGSSSRRTRRGDRDHSPRDAG